ncbi:uncharacterized protein LOC113332802 [Papaver somniferum]|uniref:uncharacterized protein LOC113332802 n=1 Tax=Papaver somniferum TaxID=3469 RepID=UPI000E6F7ABE|nr:uncharacterized protein LOC113332802 [Papaver somniferum]
MKPLMEKIISPTQAAFVPKRYINDNIVIVHELIHSMKKSKKKQGLVVLKIDMSKAFDSVEWGFVLKMMSSLGFSEDWCTIIYQCLSTTTVSIRINGSNYNSYIPSRDDCIFFFQADDKNIEQVKACLQNFSSFSGQLINFSKSSAYVTEFPNNSWIWKGLEVGLHYVKKFHIWDVRRGSKILVWYDKWVIGLDSPPTPRDYFREPARVVLVSDLMLDNPRRWNEQLVWDLFPDNITSLILQMRIPQQGSDRIIWEPSRNGEFSVKSTYKALSNIQQHAYLPSGMNWKSLWKTDAPHKINLFIWKCLKGIVPTRVILSKYNSSIDTICPRCARAEETLQHLILDYDHSRSVWLSMNINVAVLQQQQTPVSDWIETWSPPQLGVLKINMDATFDYFTKTISIGLLIRDSTGYCHGARCRFFNGGIDVEEAECLAMKEAIPWAKQCIDSEVILESDNLNVINSIKHANTSVHWRNQGIVDEIRHMLSYVTCFILNHVRRSTNKAVHVIAKTARLNRLSLDYHINIPETFCSVIRDDQQACQSKLCKNIK